jgi:hypothetical protein
MSRTKKHWTLTRKDCLTREQEARLPMVCAKWREIALSTEPSDRKNAEKAIFEIYRAEGAKEMPKVIWLNNPLDYNKRIAKWLSSPKLLPPRAPRVYTPGLGRHAAHLGAARYYKESLVNTVEATIARVVPQLPPSLRFDSVFGTVIYGYSTAREFALAEFFNTPRHQKYAAFLAAAQACHSFMLSERAAVLIERPQEIHVDANDRLHNYDGPALVHRGAKPGRIIYRASFHGVPMSRKWMETPADQIEFAEILKEKNASIRSALLGKYGLERMVKNIKHRTISKLKGNALLEFVIPGRKWESPEKRGIATLRMRMLHLKWKDKTGDRETLLPVPRIQSQFGDNRPSNIDSCEQVRHWTLGWPKEAIAVAET